MATVMSVWAELTAVGVDVGAGSTQYWQTTGTAAEYPRYVGYAAIPLHLAGAPGTNEYEVHDIAHEVDGAGHRRVLLQVTSKGSNSYGSYGLFLVFTDLIGAASPEQ